MNAVTKVTIMLILISLGFLRTGSTLTASVWGYLLRSGILVGDGMFIKMS